ncbi:MAG: carbonic anhydrase family protein [Sphingomonadales bacterium]|nr:carbonic anhydrase family protein [Sphingomonadales bacterium]
MSPEYATCKTGKEQSPLDLPPTDKAKTIDVATNYAVKNGAIENDGHGIKASFEKGFTLTSGDKSYDLLQFHFHTPSENLFGGKASPADVHFVHSDANGNLAVLGVMINEGAASPQMQAILDDQKTLEIISVGAASPQMQAILDNIGGKTDLDLKAMLPASMTAYNFKGSLTTPPCSEGVNWHVLTTPVTASKEQIEALNKITGNNARPVQPLNERAI